MREEIIEIGYKNPVVHACLQATKSLGWSEKKSLEEMVIALNESNKFLTEELIKLYQQGGGK